MRVLLAAVWIALLAIWVSIDRIYLASARQARRVVEQIEADWPEPYRFYTLQKRDGLGGSRSLTYLLYTSALMITLAWTTIVAPAVCAPCANEMRELGFRIDGPKASPLLNAK